ncbi:MAG: hypothetical protein PHF67_04935 [Candidatus Nanoarchaeia archaeon]|nr:hypothetical protein [Candidatus Nanoarchaeia archaeon]
MAIEITGINYFMPLFSFFFVLLIVYLILNKTKILGGSNFLNFLVSFIMAIVFMSFSSIELYVRNLIPWFVVLLVIVFLVLVLAAFSTKDIDKIMTSKFAWAVMIILIIIFLIVAIQVFNPIFHPDKIVTSGSSGTAGTQIINFFVNSKYTGTILLIVVAVILGWIVTKGK